MKDQLIFELSRNFYSSGVKNKIILLAEYISCLFSSLTDPLLQITFYFMI